MAVGAEGKIAAQIIGGTARAVRRLKAQSGMTLLELIISCAILLVLASAAWPIARYSALRHQEMELRGDLEDIRDAIDAYRVCAETQKIKTPVGGSYYPPDLETLVKGVPLTTNGANLTAVPGAAGTTGGASGAGGNDGKIIRFLRKIPVDPMTGHADWGLRGVEDDSDSVSWGGKDVFDVYSTSNKTAMNGTRYADW